LEKHRKGLLLIFLAALLWSTGGVFIKLISLNPFQLSFFRSLFSAITIGLLLRKKAIIFNSMTFFNAILYAAILILFVLAAKTTTIANAIFLQYTAPIFVFIFEPIILKTKFEKTNLITIIIAVIGLTLFFSGDLKPGDISGNIIAVLSGIAFAAFLIGMRKNKPEYQFATIFYGNIFIGIICFYSIISLDFLDFNDFLMVSYLGIFQIGLAYIIFSIGLKLVSATEASLISMIEPVLNPVWTYFGYGEIPSINSIIGGIILMLGLGYKTITADRKRNISNIDSSRFSSKNS